ncbi:MAG: LLM class flavin-dependent oxidoreductase, partial [Dehalococcoidia bacterium]
PHRPPIQQAKVIATVDSLSRGRVLLGAGTGYNPNEFRALGLSLRERGDLTDEYLKCMITLWTNKIASFHGKYVNFDEMTISVQPAQQPHPPILVGARGARPFRRVAELCQGYVPSGNGANNPQRLQEDLVEIMRYWKEYGRQGKPYVAVAPRYAHLTTNRDEAGGSIRKGVDSGERPYLATFPFTHVDDLVSELRAYADLGTDQVVVHLPSYRYGDLAHQALLNQQLDLLAEHVLPKIPRG